MKKGFLEACVLAAIEGGESYGYKTVEDLREVIEISESTLYPILKRLESAKYITGTSREYNGRLRKYYKLTPAGQAHLESLRQSLGAMQRIIEFIMKGGKNEN